MNLQEILARANVLAEGNFADLDAIIGHLNDAQNLIANFDPIRAEPYYTQVAQGIILLPSDLLRVHRITVDDQEYRPTGEVWGGQIIDESLTDGAMVKIFYYARPATLSSSSPFMEPRVPKKYHEAMAKYAARMFYLIDDDPPLREAFMDDFRSNLASLRTIDGVVTRFYNY